MNILSRAVRLTAQALAVVAMVAIFVLAFIVTWEVITRYFFHNPTKWVLEISTYLLVAISFFTLAAVLFAGQHVRVDILVSHLSARKQSILNLITSIIALLITIIITWQGWRFAYIALQRGEKSFGTLEAPLFPSMVLVPIGSFVLALALLIQIGETVGKLRYHKD